MSFRTSKRPQKFRTRETAEKCQSQITILSQWNGGWPLISTWIDLPIAFPSSQPKMIGLVNPFHFRVAFAYDLKYYESTCSSYVLHDHYNRQFPHWNANTTRIFQVSGGFPSWTIMQCLLRVDYL